MRLESKIAITIGLVAVLFGVWYATSEKPAPQETATTTEQPGEQIAKVETTDGEVTAEPATESRRPAQSEQASRSPEIDRPARTETIARDEPDNVENIASPAPLRLRDEAERSFRPHAAGATDTPDIDARTETAAPAPRTTVTLPQEQPVRTTSPVTVSPVTTAQPPREASSNQPSPRVSATEMRTPTTRPAVAAAPAPQRREHTVQPGDTFSSMAQKYYGDAKYAQAIMNANPDKDPRRLHVNTKIIIPPLPQTGAAALASADSGKPTEPPARTPSVSDIRTPVAMSTLRTVPARPEAPSPIPSDRAYTVKPGEGWYDLAQRFLGDGQLWPQLYEANRERVPRDPKLLRTGTVIEIPKQAARAASETRAG